MILEVKAQHQYFNRKHERVKGLEELSPTNPLYAQGFRFRDDCERTYKADGTFNIRPITSKYDLVSVCH
jgi:hypothetical protein